MSDANGLFFCDARLGFCIGTPFARPPHRKTACLRDQTLVNRPFHRHPAAAMHADEGAEMTVTTDRPDRPKSQHDAIVEEWNGGCLRCGEPVEVSPLLPESNGAL